LAPTGKTATQRPEIEGGRRGRGWSFWGPWCQGRIGRRRANGRPHAPQEVQVFRRQYRARPRAQEKTGAGLFSAVLHLQRPGRLSGRVPYLQRAGQVRLGAGHSRPARPKWRSGAACLWRRSGLSGERKRGHAVAPDVPKPPTVARTTVQWRPPSVVIW